jgi:peptidoglycan/xylan/chitin deacetylase (PgdA/CDA1 family)
MQGRKVNVPILMYHYVEPWPNNASLVRRGLTVRPENFAAQMQYLHDNGFETVGLTEVLLALTRDTPLPPKPIVITFDDGYAGLMANALPVLQQYHYTATVFVITEFMDFNRPEYLSWDDAKKLRAAGWEIEPHTKSHEELNGKSRDLQIYQMLGAMQTIEANLGYMPRFFCYPAGKYDALTIELAKELNLWGGVITVQGRDHTFADRYTWTRQRVDGQGDMKAFINLVRSP